MADQECDIVSFLTSGTGGGYSTEGVPEFIMGIDKFRQEKTGPSGFLALS